MDGSGDTTTVLFAGFDPQPVATALSREPDGFVVDTATTAAEAVDLLRGGAYDCVVVGAPGDLLLAVNGEASHGTVPLGWDICWLTTRQHDGPMAGPHRRYSYPGQGDSELSC